MGEHREALVSGRGGPEFEYSHLFQVASRKVAFIPIFISMAPGTHEYVWDEVKVVVKDQPFRLPEPFLQHPLPPELRKNDEERDDFDPLGKCRFLGYEWSYPQQGKLVLSLARINYVDYLLSGERLDSPLPGQPGKTFRDGYARHIRPSRDYRQLQLSNICGVGIFLITSDNKIIVSKHSGAVDVFPGVHSYSASGTMDWNRRERPFPDRAESNPEWLDHLNPFNQVARECAEELAHQIDEEHTRLFAFGIDAKKLYFQFSFVERTRFDSREVINTAPSAQDFYKEMDDLHAVAFDLASVVKLVQSETWEPAAEATLLALCAREFGLEAVERAIDPGYVRERWMEGMRAEWMHRAQLPGPPEMAVMSSRYPSSRVPQASQAYVKAVMDFLREDVAGRDVLEVGGGIGRLTQELLAVVGRVTCVDFCERMIERSRAALGPNADRVRYVHQFMQDYRPAARHDVVVCSLVLVHNVDEVEFRRLVDAMAGCADTIFLFEHIDHPGPQQHPHTRIRSESELVGSFPGFELRSRGETLLFRDRIVFLKLVRVRGDAGGTDAAAAPAGATTVQSSPPAGSPDAAGQPAAADPMVPAVPRGGPKMHVFLSYCREDKDAVSTLCDDLVAAGESVWWDDRILGGEDWGDQVHKAINDCYATIVCISDSLVQRTRSGVFPEVAHAIEIYRNLKPGSIFLIPVRLSGCEIPHVRIDATRTLDSLQCIDLFGPRRDKEFTRLLQSLRKAPGHP